MFVKKPDPHDEAMEILKDQMTSPPKPVHTLIIHTHLGTQKTQAQIMPSIFVPQSQKKPSTFHKEEAGLKVSRTVKSSPTGPPGSNTNLALPSGSFCKSALSIKGLKKRIKLVYVNVCLQCPESCRLRRRSFKLSSTARPVKNITLIQMFPGNST